MPVPVILGVHRSHSLRPVAFESVPADQHLLLFIVQTQGKRFEAGSYGQRLHMEQWVFVITLGQVVVGDLGAQVMDMMKSDVPAEPLQDERQFVEGTALQSRFCEFPTIIVIPIGGVKVVLNVEKPNPDRGTDHDNRQLNH